MISTSGSSTKATTSSAAVTLLSVSGISRGRLVLFTQDVANGAGVISINGSQYPVAAGAFSDVIPILDIAALTVTMTRSGSTDMSGWVARFEPAETVVA